MNRISQFILLFVALVILIGMIGCFSDNDPVTPDPTPEGTIVVDPSPDILNAPWTLTGPDNYRKISNGDQSLPGLSVGEYTLAWGSVIEYNTPQNSTQTLATNGTVTFNGAYVEVAETGTVMINQTPDDLAGASWSLSGPHDATGLGDATLTELPAGQYSLIWGDVTEYVTPTSDPLTLVVGETITFSGSYAEVPDPIQGFVIIPPVSNSLPVTFTMGSDIGNENDPHQVTLTTRIHMSATEVTYDQYMTALQWACNDDYSYGAFGYRLPNEAEWELACRAGTTTEFSTGDCLDAETEANYRGNHPFTGCPTGPYLSYLMDVGSYLANGWGLFDMHGNAAEWCNDRYDYYNGDATNPEGLSGNYRVLRGGYAFSDADRCRSARRFSTIPNSTDYYCGFRVVLSIID